MTIPDHSEALAQVAAQTLEQLAFIFSFADDSAAADGCGDDAIGAQVTFTGPLSGEILMFISRAALPELASNMLGLEEGDTPPDDQQKDALGEVLNVVCGNLLPRIGGREAVFDLQPPAIIDTAQAARRIDECRRTPAGWSTAVLSLDEGECRLYLRSIESA